MSSLGTTCSCLLLEGCAILGNLYSDYGRDEQSWKGRFLPLTCKMTFKYVGMEPIGTHDEPLVLAWANRGDEYNSLSAMMIC